MAINENELRISNKSYINKDFDAVYDELLTLAGKISDKLDPTSSNESDPFIVLLKLLAFSVDKTNYVSDKNMLERFMPSATQETSMQDLTSRLGYNMHYFISGTTSVIFKFNYPKNYDGDPIIIPQWSILNDSTGSIQYVTLLEATINKDSGTSTISLDTRQSSTPVIQGERKVLTILDDTSIHLENLDDNNRIYFPETQVAENGVFIKGGRIPEKYKKVDPRAFSDWVRVDNLNSVNYGTPCYVFRYDSIRQLPYIQFPEWIDTIIGDGLEINYIVSLGGAGNVRAGTAFSTITLSENDIPDALKGEDNSDVDRLINTIKISNPDAAANGADPETIDAAYVGFKKTIGTFDTLVTCRDFANAIYNMLDDVTENPIVSNVHVEDRRTDINYGCNVVEYKDVGVQYNSEITVPEGETQPVINAYEMCIYALNPMQDPQVKSFKDSSDYDLSFTIMEDTHPIQQALELQNGGLKTISHDYKAFKNKDIYAIKNYLVLNAVVSTNYKVDKAAQKDILTNINIALAKNFNARKVDFGYEIPYELLLKVMEDADPRIKSIGLNEPDQITKALLVDRGLGTEVTVTNSDQTTSNDWFKTIVAQNILSGKVEMFDYDKLFEYDWGQQTDADAVKPVHKITTAANIPTIPSNNSYTLKANEVVQFIAPNYTAVTSYPYGIFYSYNGPTIPANYLYRLVAPLYFIYRPAEGSSYTVDKLDAGKIIKSTFDIYSTESSNKSIPIDGDTYLYKVIGTNDQVDVCEVSEKEITSTIHAYWALNKKDNEEGMTIKWIPEDSVYYYILEEGEYFFYTPDDTEIFSYGPGTKLIVNSITTNNWQISKTNTITDISALITEGISGFVEYFKTLIFDASNSLRIQEQKIITLTEKDLIINVGNSAYNILNNEFNSSNQPTQEYPEFSVVVASNAHYKVRTANDWSDQGVSIQDFSLQNYNKYDLVKYNNSNFVCMESSLEIVPSDAVAEWIEAVEWDAAHSYNVDDVVNQNNVIYKASQGSQNKSPADNPNYWESLGSTVQCPSYDPDSGYAQGSVVAYQGDYFYAIQAVPIKSPANSAYWKDVGNIIYPELDYYRSIQYKIYGDTTTYDIEIMPSNEKWMVRSLLQLNIGPDITQTLLDSQSVTLVFDDSPDVPYKQKTLMADRNIQLTGGSNIDISYKEKKEQADGTIVEETKYPKIYIYKDTGTKGLKFLNDHHYVLDKSEATSRTLNSSGWASGKSYHEFDIVTDNDSTYVCKLNHTSDSGNEPGVGTTYWKSSTPTVHSSSNAYTKYTLVEADGSYYVCIKDAAAGVQVSNQDYWQLCNSYVLAALSLPVGSHLMFNDNAFFMVYVAKKSASTESIELTATNGNMTIYNDSTEPSTTGSSLSLSESGMYIIRLAAAVSAITFTQNGDLINAVISQPRYVKIESSKLKSNPLLGLQASDDIEDFIKKNYTEQFKKFYCITYPDRSEEIELSEDYPLSDPLSFYDYNNVANKYTIPQIDFARSKISIAKSSMR